VVEGSIGRGVVVVCSCLAMVVLGGCGTGSRARCEDGSGRSVAHDNVIVGERVWMVGGVVGGGIEVWEVAGLAFASEEA